MRSTPGAYAAEGDGNAVHSEQDKVHTGYIAGGEQGQYGLEKHQETQDQADDVHHQGEIVHRVAGHYTYAAGRGGKCSGR